MLTKILIILIKILFFIKKIIVFIFKIVKKIILTILNFLFFKIVVKIYYNYILIYKKIKEINKRNNSNLYLIKKNSSIFLIVFLVFGTISINNVKKSKAQNLSNQIHKTTLAKTIKSDFDDLEPEELIVEGAINEKLDSINSPYYLNQGSLVKSKTRINTKNENPDDSVLIFSEHGDLLSKPAIASIEDGAKTRKTKIEYSVQAGETISAIAESFGVSVNTILWENNLTARSLIKPGTKLIIPPSTGVTHTVVKNENISKIASKYNVSAESIIEANELEDNTGLKLGQKIFIPGGQKIIERAIVTTKSYSGTTITQSNNQASSQQASYSGGKLLWPTVGSRITQYYSWSHKGLDIANKTGTPLYASEAGTVERSGWNSGYGYNVVINHGGGLKTLYAHASKLHVKAGDKVGRGDIIADMGSTGWSTGPHIHYEVILNGVKQNPLNYIK